jgi:hypothetical protein
MLTAELTGSQTQVSHLFTVQVRIHRKGRKHTRFYSTAFLYCDYLSWWSSYVGNRNPRHFCRIRIICAIPGVRQHWPASSHVTFSSGGKIGKDAGKKKQQISWSF